MGIAQRLTCIAFDLVTPVTVSEADIKEELECHLQMRTEANVAAGMKPEEARRNAEARFGDFDRSFQACRKASLGARLWLRRLQLTLLPVLGTMVALLGITLLQMRAEYESEVSNLRQRIQSQIAQEPAVSSAQPDNRIPFRAFTLPTGAVDGSSSWNGERGDYKEHQPWCDWSALDNGRLDDE